MAKTEPPTDIDEYIARPEDGRQVKRKDNAMKKSPLLLSCLLALYIGLPAEAEGFKVYLSTDMEGCSGVTCSEQVFGKDGKQLMTIPFLPHRFRGCG